MLKHMTRLINLQYNIWKKLFFGTGLESYFCRSNIVIYFIVLGNMVLAPSIDTFYVIFCIKYFGILWDDENVTVNKLHSIKLKSRLNCCNICLLETVTNNGGMWSGPRGEFPLTRVLCCCSDQQDLAAYKKASMMASGARFLARGLSMRTTLYFDAIITGRSVTRCCHNGIAAMASSTTKTKLMSIPFHINANGNVSKHYLHTKGISHFHPAYVELHLLMLLPGA